MSQTRKFVGADEAGRRPGRDHRSNRTVGPALGHVRYQGGRDAQA